MALAKSDGSDQRTSEVFTRIGAARLLPVLRMPTAERAQCAASECFAAGLDVVELTATTEQWPRALAQLRAAAPDRLIGLGTVRDPETARQALALGADFVVSPCPVPAVRNVVGPGVLIEGGWTVAEVLSAGERGLAKLFPAHVGGVQYMRTLLAVDPHLRIVPTGGIRLDDVPAWLEAGAFAVGVGTDLFDQPDLAAALIAALR